MNVGAPVHDSISRESSGIFNHQHQQEHHVDEGGVVLGGNPPPLEANSSPVAAATPPLPAAESVGDQQQQHQLHMDPSFQLDFMAKDATKIFEEALDAEVLMNLKKLRETARQGIPAEYRGTLYRFLLGVSSVDKSLEMTNERIQEDDFELLRSSAVEGRALEQYAITASTSAVRGGGGGSGSTNFGSGLGASAAGGDDGGNTWCRRRHRLLVDIPELRRDVQRRERLFSVLDALEVAHSMDTVNQKRVDIFCTLAMPFEAVGKNASDIFFCTETLISILKSNGNPLQSSEHLLYHCSNFMMLLHATNDELYSHMHAEELSMLRWLPDMLTTLLASHLHLDDTLRLWDTYLTDATVGLGFPLHPYVCLALLAEHTERLIELDASNIVVYLRRFPRVDVPSIIRRAVSIREDVRNSNLL